MCLYIQLILTLETSFLLLKEIIDQQILEIALKATLTRGIFTGSEVRCLMDKELV